jgi:multicomponent Na+:H+ antiporter subunit E
VALMLTRVFLLALLWLVLAGEHPSSWAVGAPAVAAAALVSLWMARGQRVNVVALAGFLPHFLWQSITAAFDVAKRTLMPSLDIHPGTVEHRLALPAGLPRVSYMNVLSLLPGTLSASLQGDELCVHVLDTRRDHARELSRLEQRLARIFPESEHA